MLRREGRKATEEFHGEFEIVDGLNLLKTVVMGDHGMYRVVPFGNRERALDHGEVQIRCASENGSDRFRAPRFGIALTDPWALPRTRTEHFGSVLVERVSHRPKLLAGSAP